ncbi:MAG: hypothetical protein II929_03145 [Succinivibrio sp.]|nr:hypothetical protein [Succinivibrio sp.]
MTNNDEKVMDRGSFFVKYLFTLGCGIVFIWLLAIFLLNNSGYSWQFEEGSVLFSYDFSQPFVGAIVIIFALFHTYLLRKSAEKRCVDAGCDPSLSKFSAISITGIPIFIYLFIKPTKEEVTGLQVVTNDNSIIGGIADRIKTKNYVNSLETAARAKKAIETLTDTEKPSEVNVNLRGNTQTISVADELIKLVKLKEEGVITEEEFSTLKLNLLNQ